MFKSRKTKTFYLDPLQLPRYDVADVEIFIFCNTILTAASGGPLDEIKYSFFPYLILILQGKDSRVATN